MRADQLPGEQDDYWNGYDEAVVNFFMLEVRELAGKYNQRLEKEGRNGRLVYMLLPVPEIQDNG